MTNVFVMFEWHVEGDMETPVAAFPSLASAKESKPGPWLCVPPLSWWWQEPFCIRPVRWMPDDGS